MARSIHALFQVGSTLVLVTASSLAGCGEDATRPADACLPGTSCDAVGSPSSSVDAGDVRSNDLGGDGSSSSEDGAESGIPCDAWKVLGYACVSCHAQTPRYGAPMALAQQSDFQAPAPSDPSRSVHEVALERILATDPRERMPPASHEPLDDAQLTALRTWLEAGAPESADTCASDPDHGDDGHGHGHGDGIDDEPIDTTGLECQRFLAHADGDEGTPYAVGSAMDEYVNFTFRTEWSTPVYGIVLRPIIQNDQVVHHWLLFEDDEPGIDGAVSASTGAHPSGQLVAGWAPGGGAVDFRRWGDVGFEFPAGAGFTLELHYNSSDPNATDNSGVEVCVQTKKPANIAGLSWLGTDAIVGTSASGTCDPTSNEPIHILSVTPHMHTKGTHMKATIARAGGGTETLHDEDFDFNFQRGYEKDVTIMPGDTITTECTFSSFATFGESTDSEMCYLFTIAYPKGALADDGLWGNFAHGGSPCLGI